MREPQPRYIWPGDEAVMYDRPCDGYFWERLPNEPSTYAPVRPLGAGEGPQQLPDQETSSPLTSDGFFFRGKQKSEAPSLYERRTALYRCYNAAGELIYIGIAVDPERRWKQHVFGSKWWPEVKRQAVEWHGSRHAALSAEAAAIAAEKPTYNVAGRPADAA